MFTHDNRTEQFLNWFGVKFEYVDSIEYSELHPDWRVTNIGRREAIKDDAVEEYGLMMENGSAAPAVIVIQEKAGYSVLDGVQRLSAGDLNGATKFAAYVVNPRTTVSKQHMVRVFGNARINGQHSPPKSFLLESAVRVLYFEDGCSPEELARALGRQVAVVREEIRAQKTLRYMKMIGYEGKYTNGRGAKGMAAMVGKYSADDDWQRAGPPLKAMLQTIEECKFRNGDAEEFVQEFFDVKRSQKKDRYAQFEQKLKELRNLPEIKSRCGSRRGRTDLMKILPSLRAANTVIGNAEKAGQRINDGDMALAVAEVLRQIYAGLKEITEKDLLYIGNRNSSIYDKG